MDDRQRADDIPPVVQDTVRPASRPTGRESILRCQTYPPQPAVRSEVAPLLPDLWQIQLPANTGKYIAFCHAAGHSFIDRLPQRGHLRLILLLFAFERPQSRPNHLARALMPSTLDPELTNRSSSSVRFTLRVGMLRAPAHHPAPIGKMTNLAFPKTPCANRLRPQSETGSVLSVHSVVNPAHARRPGMASSENQAQRRSPSASALERL